MKILTVIGTRPEVIRLSVLIKLLDESCTHVLVHTGQNYDFELHDLFFKELGLRAPNYQLKMRGSFGEQIGILFSEIEQILRSEAPDRVLLLGDTNSALSAVVAKRLGIPVIHMEAGNRCFDDRVPEEINRRIIDHSSDVLLPYTERSREHLLREGIPAQRIFVTGNPIGEVLHTLQSATAASLILDTLTLSSKAFFLVTLHRAENVDNEKRLTSCVQAFEQLHDQYGFPVIVSTHPRCRDRLNQFGVVQNEEKVRYLKPFGLADFIRLEQEAFCVLSDSGTVQEECALLGVPNVTLRDTTERPETIECGSNTLSGVMPDQIIASVKRVTRTRGAWVAPADYLKEGVSRTVLNIVLGLFPHQAYATQSN